MSNIKFSNLDWEAVTKLRATAGFNFPAACISGESIFLNVLASPFFDDYNAVYVRINRINKLIGLVPINALIFKDCYKIQKYVDDHYVKIGCGKALRLKFTELGSDKHYYKVYKHENMIILVPISDEEATNAKSNVLSVQQQAA